MRSAQVMSGRQSSLREYSTGSALVNFSNTTHMDRRSTQHENAPPTMTISVKYNSKCRWNQKVAHGATTHRVTTLTQNQVPRFVPGSLMLSNYICSEAKAYSQLESCSRFVDWVHTLHGLQYEGRARLDAVRDA